MGKFPWGDRAFQVPEAVLIGLVFGTIVVGAVLMHYGPEGAVDSFPSAGDLRGVAFVSAGFAAVFYVLLGTAAVANGVRPNPMAKSVEKPPEPQCWIIALLYTDSPPAIKEQAYHIAGRGIYNTVEQGIPFLLLLWVHAVFVNPRTSAPLGWLVVIARFFYPYMYGMYGQMSNMVEAPQWITYSTNGYLMLAIAYKCNYDKDLHTEMADSSPGMIFGGTFAGGILICVLFLVVAIPGAKVILRGVAWDRARVEESDSYTALS